MLKFDWLQPHIHKPICDVLANPKNLRELVCLPRGWLKTTICSQAYPIWMAVHNPNVRVLLAQNNQTNARAKIRVIREQFEKNQLLRALYPDLLPTASSTWTADSLCLTRSGSFPESTFECIGVKGQATSRHYNIIIQDDTVAPDFDELGEETLAPTHDDVRKAIAWHRLAMPLLTDPGTDEIIVVGTRWYEHDLISHIKQEQPEFVSYFRSCREDADGNSDPRGEVTYPERFDENVLRQYENMLGPYFFSTLMLNHPVNVGDMIFQSEWFQEYETPPPRYTMNVYTTVDCATDPELSTGRPDKLDYSTVLTCGKDLVTGDIYVLDYFRKRCSPGEHTAAIFDHVNTWNPIEVGYEDVAYQKSIEYWLKELMRQQNKFFCLRPVKRNGRKSKETHIMGLQPMAAAGLFYIRPWMNELRTEFMSFPRGAHDDLIDTMAMQTQMWKRTRATRMPEMAAAGDEAFSFDAAVANIKAKKRSMRDSLIYDPLDQASTNFVG